MSMSHQLSPAHAHRGIHPLRWLKEVRAVRRQRRDARSFADQRQRDGGIDPRAAWAEANRPYWAR